VVPPLGLEREGGRERERERQGEGKGQGEGKEERERAVFKLTVFKLCNNS
jgi:hypothetical protein